MTPDDFTKLQSLMAARAGYALHHDRMQLAEHRLGPVARREGFHNVEALLASVWARPIGSLGWSIIETLVNGETWFRRDRHVFDLYSQQLLPALSQARQSRPVRIWVAGCSTGQEPLSLAMAALEQGIAVEVLATDIARSAVEKAGRGIYSGFEIQRGLAAKTMLRWFEPVEDQWRARPELLQSIHYDRANILDGLPSDLAPKGPFDLIFCRYVLGDMVPEAQERALLQLARHLNDGGCLFTGLDEDVRTNHFRQVAGGAGLFVKGPARDQRAA
ncbi:protein-glutamate O-methyltransferase CheR [uncultured Brevundimonas sp.]|uniref:CheR family methyltransferase n=1 Tax=uncultured Brevundimonas sp. TaxID=213418 RepID=UPI002613C39F|nr:protein-glutamate O-methyltransferase CheR [uncultured Brevundimonas sp.]